MSEQANHHWWMFFSHEWHVVSVRSRFEPFRDPDTGQINTEVGWRKTDILYRCACGKVKVKAVRGEWTLAEVRGRGERWGREMSLECSECERDLRGGHDEGCSRYVPLCNACNLNHCDEECDCECHQSRAGVER